MVNRLATLSLIAALLCAYSVSQAQQQQQSKKSNVLQQVTSAANIGIGFYLNRLSKTALDFGIMSSESKEMIIITTKENADNFVGKNTGAICKLTGRTLMGLGTVGLLYPIVPTYNILKRELAGYKQFLRLKS